MKISEYYKITREYEEELERRFQRCRAGLEKPEDFDALKLFDAIELRDCDVHMWLSCGLDFEDEVPERSDKTIMPSFEVVK